MILVNVTVDVDAVETVSVFVACIMLHECMHVCMHACMHVSKQVRM